MKKRVLVVSAMVLGIGACAGKKLNKEALEKYPQCYHQNVKISNKCIEKNEAGENVTALQLENTAYPGQYK